MEKTYTEDRYFEGIKFPDEELIKGDYENCTFVNCSFLNFNLSEINFVECIFKNCDLSMANINSTTLRDISFSQCKLVGLQFEKCNKLLFSVNFEECQLNVSSFYKMDLKNITFDSCNLQETDFVECDLSGSVFEHCNLAGASFVNSNLQKADFRTAYGFSINPELNRIKKAKFSLPGIKGLLDAYDIEVG